MGFIFGILVLGVPVTLIILCVRLFTSWPESHRWLALVPLIPFPIWIVSFLFDIGRDATSHNLFPVEIVGLAILGFMLLPIVAIIHDFKMRRAAKKAAAPTDTLHRG